MSKTMIVCTLGPASSRAEVIGKMMRAGMDIARLNFSHGSLQDHERRIRLIRQLNAKYRRKTAILGDLEGHRIRIGRLKQGKPVAVAKGREIWLTQEKILGAGSVIPFDYQGPLDRIKKGRHIFIDDGHIDLEVTGHLRDRLKTRVVIPGIIKERKGINMPDVHLDFRGLTPKDKADVRFCIDNQIGWIAQSFVRNREDVLQLRAYLTEHDYRCRIIAKIENREGIRNIDEIMAVSDGIMIARGDMGISVPVYEVPVIQKTIIRQCNRAGKFVITATQMLESMIDNHIPTRAEVSDVANAVLDGSDGVMLSAETAVGAYPVDCVAMMDRIVRFTKSHRIAPA